MTRYKPDYLSGILEQLTKPLSGGGRSVKTPSPPYHPFFFGAQLQVFDEAQWRYDEVDEAGQTVLSLGYDGAQGWRQDGLGSREMWTPTRSDDPRQLPESAWEFHASLVVREVIEPVLMLPALAIDDALPLSSGHGAAVRLVGHPQLADRIESALVSLAAKTCMVDIHQDTGTVIGATNLDEAGDVLVKHTVDELHYGSI